MGPRSKVHRTGNWFPNLKNPAGVSAKSKLSLEPCVCISPSVWCVEDCGRLGGYLPAVAAPQACSYGSYIHPTRCGRVWGRVNATALAGHSPFSLFTPGVEMGHLATSVIQYMAPHEERWVVTLSVWILSPQGDFHFLLRYVRILFLFLSPRGITAMWPDIQLAGNRDFSAWWWWSQNLPFGACPLTKCHWSTYWNHPEKASSLPQKSLCFVKIMLPSPSAYRHHNCFWNTWKMQSHGLQREPGIPFFILCGQGPYNLLTFL